MTIKKGNWGNNNSTQKYLKKKEPLEKGIIFKRKPQKYVLENPIILDQSFYTRANLARIGDKEAAIQDVCCLNLLFTDEPPLCFKANRIPGRTEPGTNTVWVKICKAPGHCFNTEGVTGVAPGPDCWWFLRLTKSRLLSDSGGAKYLIGLRPQWGYQSFMFYMQIGKEAG